MNLDDNEIEVKPFALAVSVFAAILVLLTVIVTLIVTHNTRIQENANTEIIEQAETEEPLWDYMIQALIIVESEGDPHAVGKTNDLGILQITPIYVKEVNRILKEERYDLSDRTNIYKSLEMFEVYQEHHNPDKDILTAIKIHNTGAGKWYIDKVMNQLNRITEIQS